MDVDTALQSQLRNIEHTYGKPLSHWLAIIDASRLTKHTEVVAMLKNDHRLAHGAAHRLSLLARNRDDTTAASDDPVTALYTGAKQRLRALHDAVIAEINELGEFAIVPKTGYLSLRRRKQFAMLQPSTTGRLDLGLILPAGTQATGRLESAAGFNALFTHRVRLTSPNDVDQKLQDWLSAAYNQAQ